MVLKRKRCVQRTKLAFRRLMDIVASCNKRNATLLVRGQMEPLGGGVIVLVPDVNPAREALTADDEFPVALRVCFKPGGEAEVVFVVEGAVGEMKRLRNDLAGGFVAQRDNRRFMRARTKPVCVSKVE